MSKSYSNYKKFGICVGNNSLFYKAKRKYLRRINKYMLRNALSKGDLNITFKKVSEKYNDWNEPTDGTILENANGCKLHSKTTYIFKNKIKK